MIIFDHVTKTYPLGNKALDDVSFSIEDKEFVFMVGPSGAGKTTILKLLLGQSHLTAGNIIVNNLDISSKKFHNISLLRKRIGVIFQDFKILFDKNIYENVLLSLKIIGNMSQVHMEEEAHKALELVNLPHKKFVFPVQLSAGELQRVAIARAIAGNRDIILADEPTGNLDPKTTWDIMRIFTKLEGKKTILIATHNSDVVNSFKKRVLIMKDGQLAKDSRKGGYEL